MTAELRTWFFSYARSDGESALSLAKELRAAGVNVWIDQLDIQPGERWDQAVEAALRRCGGLIVVLSPASVSSNNVMDEVSYALDAQKLVVPVLLAECEIPLRLRRLQNINLGSNYAAGVTVLRQALTVRNRAGEHAEAQAARVDAADALSAPSGRAQARTAPQRGDKPAQPAAVPQPRHASRLRNKLWIGLGVLVAVIAVGLLIRQQAGESTRTREEIAALQREVDVAETVSKAEAGDTWALNKLADLYRFGLEGMPKDVPKAVTLYRKAVEKAPNSLALLSLAFIYMHGAEGVKPDPVEALMWSYLNGDRNYEKAQAYADIKTLESRLSPGQIAEAKSRAEAWYKAHYSRSDK